MPGLVEPRFKLEPTWHVTLGPEVVDLCVAVDFTPDPEQAMILDATFGLDKAGKLVTDEVDVIASRQNLKTGLFKQCALGWLVVDPVELVVWSAHEFSTAQEAARDLTVLFENYDVLSRRVKRITTGAAYKAIEMLAPPGWPAAKDAPRLVFKARASNSGRGLTAPRLVLDEGFALDEFQMGSIIPVMSAMEESQYLVGSSAGKATSAVLREIRDRGRSRTDPRQAYYEWTSEKKGACAREDCDHAKTTRGCGLDKPELIRQANPAIGRRPGLTLEKIQAERRKLPPDEFGRERAGWWDDPIEMGSLFPEGAWAKGLDEGSELDGSPTFGVAIQWGRKRAAVGLAGPSTSGKIHLEPVECHALQSLWDVDDEQERPGIPGVDGLVALCARLSEQWDADVVLDGGGPAAELIPKLSELIGEHLVIATVGDVLDATAGISDAVEAGRHAHLGDPDLDDAAGGAQKRPVLDRFAIGRKLSTFDTSPLEAVTLAAWRAGLTTSSDAWGFFA